MKPVHVFVGRQELVGYTSLTLTRSKNEMTGQLSVELFMGWMPQEPVLAEVARGAEILVYVGGHLAFTGVVDRRIDSGEREYARNDIGQFTGGQAGTQNSINIGPNQYRVTLACRGKTRALVDSSHQHDTGNFLDTTNKGIFENLLAPWGVELEWAAEVEDMVRHRLRDGGRVVDELQRLAEQASLYVFETRRGALRVTDQPNTETGEPIVLGSNILSFNTSQAADSERSEVLVKGSLNKPEDWGEAAVLPTLRRVADRATKTFSPITVKHYGDATEAALQKRADYEANKRAAKSKRIEVDVFHVQQSDGEPWDIGRQHYVEIPPAGVSGMFEVADVRYKADGKTLTTKLTLVPAQVAPASASATAGDLLSGLDNLSGLPTAPAGRKAIMNISNDFADSWAGPSVQVLVDELLQPVEQILEAVESFAERPPLSLPPGFTGADE